MRAGARVDRLERMRRPAPVRPEIRVRLGWYDCQELPPDGAHVVQLVAMPDGPQPWEVEQQAVPA